MKKNFLTDDYVRYLDPSITKCFKVLESAYQQNKMDDYDHLYSIVPEKERKSPNSKEKIIGIEKQNEIKLLLFYRRHLLYSFMKNIQPHERTNMVAYELAVRTPEIIDAIKSGMAEEEFRKKYWLEIKECIDFEEALCTTTEYGIYYVREPFSFIRTERGEKMIIPFSFPEVRPPRMSGPRKIIIEIDLTLPCEEISSMMNAYEQSLIEYKHRMDVMSLTPEEDFLSSKEKYFKGISESDKAMKIKIKSTKYPNQKNNSIVERFFAYDMAKAGFSRNAIIESMMLYRCHVMTQSMEVPFESNQENMLLFRECMTSIGKTMVNDWIDIVQQLIDEKHYKKYISPLYKMDSLHS